MKLLSNKKTLSLSLVLLGIVWCLAISAAATSFVPHLSFWGGMICGIISIAIAVIYLLYFRFSPGSQAVEVGAVSIYYTITFLVISVTVNTAFIFIRQGNFNGILLTVNAFIDAIFVILTFYMEKDAVRVASQLNRTEKKISFSTNFSQTLGSLIGTTTDDIVRSHLIKLKESVDYSSNISTASTLVLDQEFTEQLSELDDMITACVDSGAILQKLQQAEHTWKRRCSALASPQ